MSLPRSLDKAGRRLWRLVTDDFELTPSELVVLERACAMADRAEAARAAIAEAGTIIEDRFGQKVAHPGVTIERQASIALLRALRELSLSKEAAAELARPPLIAGRYVQGRRHA